MAKVNAKGGFNFTPLCLPTFKENVGGFLNGEYVTVDFNHIEIDKNGVIKVLVDGKLVTPTQIVPTPKSFEYFGFVFRKLKRISVDRITAKKREEKLAYV